MKFETILLKSFFAAAVLTCVLTFGAMVATSAAPASANRVATAR